MSSEFHNIFPNLMLAKAALLVLSLVAQASGADVAPWQNIDSVDVAKINQDLDPSLPTVDVGIYYPSNFDASFRKLVPLNLIVDEFVSAKKIMADAGVQVKLLFAKTGPVDPVRLSLHADERAQQMPNDGYVNLYRHKERHPTQLSQVARDTFNDIIDVDPHNDRTLYLVILQSVFMAYYETEDDGRNWSQHLVRTGGLSLPGYIYGDSIPRRLRGVITLSGTKKDSWRRTAHEFGHKLMNVSHEYNEQGPQHEIVAEGGLMLYGSGTDIPSGVAGRWHRERLHMSPFIYRINAAGERVWNPDYHGKGFYYDALYGDKAVEFAGSQSPD